MASKKSRSVKKTAKKPPKKAKATQGIQLVTLSQAHRYRATASTVFDALTRNVGRWWGAPYVYEKYSRGIQLEPHVGGRFYDVWGQGEGHLWGTVTSLKNDEWLEITGTIGMDGVVQARVCFELEESGGETNLKLTHTAMGEVNEAARKMYAAGWEDLLGLRLKRFVESSASLGMESATAH